VKLDLSTHKDMHSVLVLKLCVTSALDPVGVDGFMPFPSPLGRGVCSDPLAFVDGSTTSIYLTLSTFSPSD
jgi:hypothetical protein